MANGIDASFGHCERATFFSYKGLQWLNKFHIMTLSLKVLRRDRKASGRDHIRFLVLLDAGCFFQWDSRDL